MRRTPAWRAILTEGSWGSVRNIQTLRKLNNNCTEHLKKTFTSVRSSCEGVAVFLKPDPVCTPPVATVCFLDTTDPSEDYASSRAKTKAG